MKYWEAGFNPIPAFGKYPMLDGYPEWGQHRMSQETVEGLIDQFPHAIGIGIVCGKFGVAVDVDANSDELMSFVDSPMKRVGRKGFVAIFQPKDGAELIKDEGDGFAIEFLSAGEFVALPPGNYPKPKDDEPNVENWPTHYKWCEGSGIIDFKELPEISFDDYKEIKKVVASMGLSRPLRAKKQHVDGQPQSYQSGRNDYLCSCAKAWVFNDHRLLGSTMSDGVNYLLNLDKKYHGERAYFYDEPEHNRKGTPDERALKLLKSVKKSCDRLVPEQKVVVEVGSVLSVQHPEQSDSSYTGWESLVLERSLQREMYNYLTSATGFENPSSWFAVTLAMNSFLANNVYRFGNTRSNMHIMNIAASGSGKSVARSAMKTLIEMAGFGQLIGPERYKSRQSVLVRLDAMTRKRIDFLDEFHIMARDAMKPISHLSGLFEVLNGVWSDSSGQFSGETAATKERIIEPVYNPCITICASAVKTQFEQIITPDLASNGFTARSLWIIDYRTAAQRLDEEASRFKNNMSLIMSDEDQMEFSLASQAPKAIIDRINKILSKPLNYGGGAYNAGSATGPIEASPLTIDRAVKVALTEYGFEKRVWAIKNEAEQSQYLSSMQRAVEQMQKLMISWAVACDTETVTMAAFDWAKAVFEKQFAGYKKLFNSSVFHGGGNNKAYEYIESLKAAGKVQIWSKDLRNKLAYIFSNDSRASNEWIKLAVEAGILWPCARTSNSALYYGFVKNEVAEKNAQ